MSTLRMPVEHVIRHLKKYRMPTEVYRGNLERYDENAPIIAVLVADGEAKQKREV
jgi:hypothetical protein